MQSNLLLKILSILLTFIAGLITYYVFPEKKLLSNAKVDSIVVLKSKRKLLVYSNGQLLKTYTVSLGGQPIGKKEYEGDMKTPEGSYIIYDKTPNSGYHKNLGVSYPSPDDIENAKLLGKPAGGQIKIHGLRNGQGFIGKFHRWTDWTHGCIAMTNKEIDELYNAVDIGTNIEIKP